MADPMNAVRALASPFVPAFADMGLFPIIPPMPPIMICVFPLMPFMTPSEASFVIRVIMPEETGIPIVCAYFDMAAIAIP